MKNIRVIFEGEAKEDFNKLRNNISKEKEDGIIKRKSLRR